jgi:prepilin-type N-terminal cleavage/methylation domain-containing protein
MSRKGFTLLEVVLVVVVLLVLAGITFGLLSWVERCRVESSAGRVHTLGVQAATEAKLKGFPPATLEELIPKMDSPQWIKDGKFVDAWDRPIQYRVDGKSFDLWSCGPDGISGTGDDLHYKRK